MVFRIIKLKGRKRKSEEQRKVVLGGYHDLERRIGNVCFMTSELKDKGLAENPPTDDEVNRIYRKYRKCVLRHGNVTHNLKEEWEAKEVRGDFPEWKKKDSYEKGLKSVGDFLKGQGKVILEFEFRDDETVQSDDDDDEEQGDDKRGTGNARGGDRAGRNPFDDDGEKEGDDNDGDDSDDEENTLAELQRRLDELKGKAAKRKVRTSSPKLARKSKQGGVDGLDSYKDAVDEMEAFITRMRRKDDTSKISNIHSDKDPAKEIKFKVPLYQTIPTFSGKYSEFAEFMDLFGSYVDSCTDLTPSAKLFYLKGKLNDRLRQRFEQYPGDQYEKVLKMLVDEYTRPEKVIVSIRDTIEGLPRYRWSNDEDNLRIIVERVRSTDTLFRKFALDLSFEQEVFGVFLGMLPRWMTEDYIRALGNGTPNLSVFLRYLDEAMTSIATRKRFDRTARENKGRRVTFDDDYYGVRKFGGDKVFSVTDEQGDYDDQYDSDRTSQDDFFVNTGTEGSRASTSGAAVPGERRSVVDKRARGPCQKCGNPEHSMIFCPEVSRVEKVRIMKELKLCFICVKPGHLEVNCSSPKRCFKCKGFHLAAFCSSNGVVSNEKGDDERRAVRFVQRAEQEPEEQDTNSEWDPVLFNDSLQGFKGDRSFNVSSVKDEKEWPLEFHVGDKPLVGIVDTGATVNLIPSFVTKLLGVPTYRRERTLSTSSGELTVKEAVKLEIRIGDCTGELEFLLYDKQPVIILGKSVIRYFKLICHHSDGVVQEKKDNGEHRVPLTKIDGDVNSVGFSIDEQEMVDLAKEEKAKLKLSECKFSFSLPTVVSVLVRCLAEVI